MSSRSRSTKATTNITNNINGVFEGNNNNQVVGNGNTIEAVDFGSVQAAFDAFEDVIQFGENSFEAAVQSNENVVERALNNSEDIFDKAIDSSSSMFNTANDTITKALTDTTATVDKVTRGLKDFAMRVSAGDQLSAQWIAMAVIAAVVVVAVAFFVWGK